MGTKIENSNEAAAADVTSSANVSQRDAATTAQEITDKRGYAARWQGSVRWLDGLLARGLPHLKIGKRRVRIVISEADKWMREQFFTQRRSIVPSH